MVHRAAKSIHKSRGLYHTKLYSEGIFRFFYNNTDYTVTFNVHTVWKYTYNNVFQFRYKIKKDEGHLASV